MTFQFFLILQQTEIKLGPKQSFPDMAKKISQLKIYWITVSMRICMHQHTQTHKHTHIHESGFSDNTITMSNPT